MIFSGTTIDLVSMRNLKYLEYGIQNVDFHVQFPMILVIPNQNRF